MNSNNSSSPQARAELRWVNRPRGATWLVVLLLLLTSCGSQGAAPSTTSLPTEVTTSALVPATPTLAPTAAPTATATNTSLMLSPCTLAGGLRAECGTYSVYEDRESRTGLRIDLRVAVVRAREPNPEPDPLVYLTGGPGGAATEAYPPMAAVFSGVNMRRDILLVDQRGTGGSHRLLFPPPPPAALDPGSTPEEKEAVLKPWLDQALHGLDGDPRFYTTALAMDDIDDVREALGYDKVNLYGVSYGATAAQFYLKQHPGRVRTVILDGGTLLDVPIFELIAPNGQRALDMAFERCGAEKWCNAKFPSVRAEMRQVYERLGKEPVRVQGVTDPSSNEALVFTQGIFAEMVRTKLLSAAGTATLPRLIHKAYQGDYTELAAMYVGQASYTTDVSRQVMMWSIRCSESWARFSPDEVARLGAATYFVDAQYAEAVGIDMVCKAVPEGVSPLDDGKRVRSDVPVLMMNGDGDPQDPPSNVADAERELPNSLRITVPGHGHGVIQYGCMSTIATAFVTKGTWEGLKLGCVDMVPVPDFDTRD